MTNIIELDIVCGEGTETYLTTLRAKNQGVFENAEKDPNVIGKTGEARVEAILAVAKGDIYNLVRTKDGKRQTGPKGEPGMVTFDLKGEIDSISHYSKDEMNDYHGEAAYQKFGEFDIEKTHYKNGVAGKYSRVQRGREGLGARVVDAAKSVAALPLAIMLKRRW